MQAFDILVYSWIGIAVITLLILVFSNIRAPYGRHANDKWGKMIDNRWGWFIMELPALVLFPLLVLVGPSEKNALTWLLVGLWTLHYFNRTIIFPLRLRTTGKKMPLTIIFSALFFNGMNGVINGYFLGFLNIPEAFNVLEPHIIIGLVLFFAGMLMNHISDSKLIALRKEQQGYQIPRGWLFEYISCPNHFSEILEWTGFAIVAWSMPAASFAIWSFCNLVPRALNHHTWYAEQFSDYPKQRKAVVPFIW